MPRLERQTAHVALLIKPSMKRGVERRARTEGVTANEFIRRAVELALVGGGARQQPLNPGASPNSDGSQSCGRRPSESSAPAPRCWRRRIARAQRE